MSLRGKSLYHGTTRKIKGDRLSPSKSCRTIKGRKFCDRIPKVYTTTNKDVALLFAANIPFRDAEIMKSGKVVYYIGKKDLNRFKGPGWIYKVEKKGFKKGPRRKYDEYISISQVKIVKKIFVPNLYNYIMKRPNIILVMKD